MHYFYKPDLKSTLLNPEESHYAVRVLRHKDGDEIMAFDGKGSIQKLRLTKADAKKCQVDILESIEESQDRKYAIHVALSPTKQMDRIEWFVEKCVEMGIDTITFLNSERSIRSRIKPERIEKIILSAARQSGNMLLPAWYDMVNFKDFIQQYKADQLFIAHLAEGDRRELFESVQGLGNYTIMIGPEGDFTEEEITFALANGVLPVSLGKSRLRTETAGIVACHTLNLALRSK